MLRVIFLDIANRRNYYLMFCLGAFIAGFFLDLYYIVFAVCLIQIRINQLLCYSDLQKGILGYLFYLPISRRSIVAGKNLSVFIIIVVALTLAFCGNEISSSLGISHYTENTIEQIKPLFTLFGMIAGSVFLIIIQYYFLLSKQEEIIIKLRIAGIFFLMICILFFILLPSNEHLMNSISFVADRFFNLLLGIPLIILLGGTILTIRKVNSQDIYL